MQRINRSAHAPVGTAFFLFLGLAILPFSLRAAGVQVSFSPRLAAAMDAWQQIAEVFGASYHPAPASELSVVKDLDSDPSNPIDGSVSPLGEFVCNRGPEDSAEKLPEKLPEKLNDVRNPCALKESPVRRASPKVALRDPFATKRIASVVVASFEDHARAMGVQGSRKLETMTCEELLKSIEKQVRPNFEAITEIRNFPISISKRLRVLVRTKRVAASSSAKEAECKVFSALDSARRHECDRAILTSMPSANPDNSEF